MDLYLEKELTTAFKEIKPIVKADKAYLKMKPIDERQKAVDLLGSLYIRYIKVVNSLTEIHNYLLNPLKRNSLKTVIETIFGRIVELRHEMNDVEKSDYVFLDNITLQNYMTIKNLNIKIPQYFRDEREVSNSLLFERIDHVLYLKELALEEEEDLEEEEVKTAASTSRMGRSGMLSVASAPQDEKKQQKKAEDKKIKRPEFVVVEHFFEFTNELILIQRHERARAGRLKTNKMREKQDIARAKAWHIYKPIPVEKATDASDKIKAYYMNYKNRSWKKYVDVYKGLTYGTLLASYQDRSHTNELNKLMEKRKKDQKDLEIATINKKNELMEQMSVLKKYEIIEDMTTELRAFIKQWYDYTFEYGYAEVPEWPSDQVVDPPTRVCGIPEGMPQAYVNSNFNEFDYSKLGPPPNIPLAGSELITAGYWIPVELYAPAAEYLRTLIARGTLEEDKGKTDAELELQKEREEQKRLEEMYRLEELMKMGHVPTPSKFLKTLNDVTGEFVLNWNVGKPNDPTKDGENIEERLKIEVVYKIMKDVREEVDDQMRKELKILKAAIKKDNVDRIEYVVKKKKPKVKEPKKKKGKKDPLEHRTVDSLLDELIEEGLIIKCDPIDLDSLSGQYNYHAYESRIKYENPNPYLGDVYEVAKEYIVLPLASPTVKEFVPEVKSVLFAGPDRLTHKIVHGIANCTGATLMYLPALNFTQRFKQKLLISMILKVAKAFEPTVIFIDGAEKPFYGKVPKHERAMRPKALKGLIPKVIKGFKGSDRIIVIGTAEKPWLSKPQLVNMFKKILICPDTDYHTMSSLVQGTIMSHHGVDREFDTSIPSALLMGHPLTEVEKRLKSIFTTDRILSLNYKPLQTEETGCIEKDSEKDTLLDDWYSKSYPLNVERKQMIEAEKEKRDKMAKATEKAAG